MPARVIAIASLCAVALAVAGCGSTTIRHVTTTITRQASSAHTTSSASTSSSTSTTTPTHTTAASAPPSRLDGRSPGAVLRLAAAALRHSGGYAMRADLLQSGKRTIIDLAADGVHRYEASLSTAGTMFSLVALPGSAYLRGDAAFWRSQLSAGGGAQARRRASALAGHWLRVPGTGAHAVTRSLGTLIPGTLARCLTEDHGTLTLAGHATIGHTRALIVRDAGNAPGATPSTIAVAATGTPYPLRYVATGATRRGGRVDVCNDGKGDGATGTIGLSQFGAVPTVQAPSHVSGGDGSPT